MWAATKEGRWDGCNWVWKTAVLVPADAYSHPRWESQICFRDPGFCCGIPDRHSLIRSSTPYISAERRGNDSLSYSFPVLYILSSSTTTMTIISAETLNRTIPRRNSSVSGGTLARDAKDSIARLTTLTDEPRPIPTRSASRLLARRPQASNLVEEFIQSCKDLEAYK